MIAAAALAAVPGCEAGGPPLELERLPGGTANQAYRVRTARGEFVLRLHDPASAQSGVDRARERLLQQQAAAAGLAPGIVAADPAGQFWVSEFLPGSAWRSLDMGEPVRLARLARQLSRLHAIAPPAAPPLDLAALIGAHAERITHAERSARAERSAHTERIAQAELSPDAQRLATGGGARGPALAPLLDRARAILADCAAQGRRACIVHGDLYHANLIGPEPRLIDWEYAAVTDPLFDLACLLAYYPQAGAHQGLLLAESGLEGRVAPGELEAAAWVYVLLSYLWYRAFRIRATPGPHDLEHEARLLARLSGAG